MKVLLVASLIFIIGCNSTDKKENKNVSMPGAYKMLSQSEKTDKIDTTYTSLEQLKIYTDDYMMYANFDSHDSLAGFGIATYTTDKDTVTENVIYRAYDSSFTDSVMSVKLAIEKTGNGYKQVIPDIISNGEHIKLTEEYDSTAGAATKSPLDGAWKQTRSSYIKGKDTTTTPTTQYKVYFAGHVIWGHTYADSAHKTHTGIGFGTFEMNGNNKVKESMVTSNYPEVAGKNFDLNIEMNGTDEFTQTINDTDGSKGIEVYQRLKK